MKIFQPVKSPAFYVKHPAPFLLPPLQLIHAQHEATASFWLLISGARCCSVHSCLTGREQSWRRARHSIWHSVCCQLPWRFFITQDYKLIHEWVSTLLPQDPVEQGIRLLVMLLLRGSLGLFLAEIWVACFPAEDQLQKQHQAERLFWEWRLCLPC